MILARALDVHDNILSARGDKFGNWGNNLIRIPHDTYVREVKPKLMAEFKRRYLHQFYKNCGEEPVFILEKGSWMVHPQRKWNKLRWGCGKVSINQQISGRLDWVAHKLSFDLQKHFRIDANALLDPWKAAYAH